MPGELYNSAAPGKRLVAVHLSIKNVGRRTVRDSPSNGAKLITRSGKALDTTLYTGDGCTSISNTVIPRGQTRRGCLVFELAAVSRLRYFELTWSSGFADETGQWRFPS